MLRVAFLAFSLLAILFTVGRAQPPEKGVQDGSPLREPDPVLWTTNLTASATAAPKPVLRYELLPGRRELTPGNAALSYSRAIILRPPYPRDPKAAQAQREQTEQWSKLPIDQLPTAKLEAFLAPYRDLLNEVDDAARRIDCDWQWDRLKITDLSSLFPVVQGHREMVSILHLRTRLLLAQKKYDEAFRSIQTCYQMGKHLTESTTLIEYLVGIAISQIALAQLQDWAGLSQTPNLYWAMTSYPRPLANARQALEGETRFHAKVPLFKDLEQPMNEATALKLLREVYVGMASDVGMDENLNGLEKLTTEVGLRAEVAFRGPAAKKDLVALGEPAEKIEKMSQAQAMLLRAVYRYREGWDDGLKLFYLPTHVALKELDAMVARAKVAREKETDDPLNAILALHFPSLAKVRFASARFERRFELFRAVEAVRLQTATNGGKLPATLAEVTTVPVPLDPFTNKPFEYSVKDRTFTLTAPRTKADQPNMGEHIYNVTIRP
jgi:hypothetical protein